MTDYDFPDGTVYHGKTIFDHGCFIKFAYGKAERHNGRFLSSKKEKSAIYMVDEIFELIEININRYKDTWAHYYDTEITSSEWHVLRGQYRGILDRLKSKAPQGELIRYLSETGMPHDFIKVITTHQTQMATFLTEIMVWADWAIAEHGIFTIYGM